MILIRICIRLTRVVATMLWCVPHAREVEYLGQLISRLCIRTTGTRVPGIRNFPLPKQKVNLMAFIGTIINYLRRYHVLLSRQLGCTLCCYAELLS